MRTRSVAVEIDELMAQNDVPADVAMELNEKEENFLKQYEDLQKPEIPTSPADPAKRSEVSAGESRTDPVAEKTGGNQQVKADTESSRAVAERTKPASADSSVKTYGATGASLTALIGTAAVGVLALQKTERESEIKNGKQIRFF